MSAPVVKPTKPGAEAGEEVQLKNIRITVTSRKVDALEKFCSEIKAKALTRQIKVKGPVRLPTKKLKLVVRKSPCGEGTNTWDRFQMRIHKRIIDMRCAVDVVKQLTTINVEPGVDIDVTMDKDN